MDNNTLKALQGSIAKWEGIVNGTSEDNGSENCPLCLMYNNDISTRIECAGCPVAAAAADFGCGGTPYTDWSDYQHINGYRGFPQRVFDDCSREIAQEELDFLKSLLPENK